jgi:hypothetical protein
VRAGVDVRATGGRSRAMSGDVRHCKPVNDTKVRFVGPVRPPTERVPFWGGSARVGDRVCDR